MKRISRAQYFSILGYETTDASNVEQMCRLDRYVDHEKHCIRENFISCVDVRDGLTESGLATAILHAVVNASIPLASVVGQGYDGAASMSGRFNAVQSRVRAQYPLAVKHGSAVPHYI